MVLKNPSSFQTDFFPASSQVLLLLKFKHDGTEIYQSASFCLLCAAATGDRDANSTSVLFFPTSWLWASPSICHQKEAAIFHLSSTIRCHNTGTLLV
jgi:hypothetical protein